MNRVPYAGYFFYGAATDSERAHYASSWGLMATAPTETPPAPVTGIFSIPLLPHMLRKLKLFIRG